MFEWCKGSELRAMVDAGIENAAYDDWQEGWMFGLLQGRLEPNNVRNVLDITLGEGPRPYLESFRDQGAEINSIEANRLTHPETLADGAEKYDLVTLLSLERENCLQPLDLENPVPLVERLLNAAKYLAPGGALVWSHLYCFPADPDGLCSFLEPEAVYLCLMQRQFAPLSRAAEDYVGTRRVLIYQDPDTLFVRQRAILEHANQQERVTRFCCGVTRRGAGQRINYLTHDQFLEKISVEASDEHAGER